MIPRPVIVSLAVVPAAALAPLAGCYSSYARTASSDASTDDGTEVTCTIRERGPRVETGIDTPTSTHHHYDFTWTGDGYIVTWDDAEEEGAPNSVWFSRMSPSGDLVGSITTPSSSAPESTALNPRLAWSGSMVGISWDTYYPPQAIRFRVLDDDGTTLSSIINLVVDPTRHVWGIQSVIAWTGAHFAVAWPYEDVGPNADGIAVAFVSAAGTPHGAPLTFSEGYTGHPDIQGHDGMAALLWRGVENTFTLFEPDGTIVAQSTYTDETGMARHLAVGPDGYGVIWSQDGFYFVALGSDGTPLIAPLGLADTNAGIHSADIVWTTWGWAIAWQERWSDPGGLPSPVRVVILESDGSTRFETSMVEIVDEGVSEAHLVWTGSELGMMWNGRDVSGEPVDSLIFTRFVCD